MKEATEPKDLKTLLTTFYGNVRAQSILSSYDLKDEKKDLTEDLNHLDALKRMQELNSASIKVAEELGVYEQATGKDSAYLRRQLEELSKELTDLGMREAQAVLDRISTYQSMKQTQTIGD